MLFMIIETFRRSDVPEIYTRLEKQGRMMPKGLEYIDSWVDVDRTCCFQLMMTEDENLLEEWMNHWKDLIEFRVVPVIPSSEMQRIASSERKRSR